MREALNRLGQYVDADTALSGQRLYTCPECRAPVSLRAGGSKRAYFAHMPGRSGKLCNLYVEGGAYGSGMTAPDNDVDANRIAMHLGLRLSEAPIHRGWGLELIVPTSGHVGLELTVDVGGRTEVVRCTTATEKQKNIIVEPITRDYEILKTSSYIANLERRCEGLDARYATVFGEIRRPGKELAKRVCEVRVGQTYGLVWPASIVPAFPPHLDYVPLKNRQGWDGALITFAYPVKESVQKWFKRFTGLEVAITPPEIVPVWPPLVRRVTGGLIEAPAKSALIVSAGRLTANGIIGARALFSQSLNGERAQSAKSVNEPFFQFVPEREDAVDLICVDPARASLSIDIVASTPYTPQSVVKLSAVNNQGEIQSVGLHEDSASSFLNAIRFGKFSLKCLSIPNHVIGKIAIGRNGLWEERLKLSGSNILAPQDTGSRLLSSVDVSTLADILANPNYDVLLDFGAFGRAISVGSAMTAHIPTLSKGLKDRILAYFFQTHGRISPCLNARDANDTEIISEFLKEAPNAADAMWRSLKSALDIEIKIRKFDARTRI